MSDNTVLIQTAFQQEYQAIVRALRRDAGWRVDADLRGRLVAGQIGDRRCWVVKTGIGRKNTRRELAAALALIERPGVLVSIGFAGAVLPRVRVGERFLIQSVGLAGSEPDPLLPALHCLAPEYVRALNRASLLTVDRPALTPGSKAALAACSTAELCDMETHAVAALAVEHGLPWLGARIVSDAAGETLRAWFMRLPGLVDEGRWLTLAGQLGTHPQDLPRLLGLAYRTRTLQHQLSQFITEFIVNVVAL